LDAEHVRHGGAVVLVVVADIDHRDMPAAFDQHIAIGELAASGVEGALEDEALRHRRHIAVFQDPDGIVGHAFLPWIVGLPRRSGDSGAQTVLARGHQWASQPASIGSEAPVMSRAAGPQRKTISSATLPASTKRPAGWRSARNFRSAVSRERPSSDII